MGSCPDTDIDPKTEGHIDDHHKDIKLIESKIKKKKKGKGRMLVISNKFYEFLVQYSLLNSNVSDDFITKNKPQYISRV